MLDRKGESRRWRHGAKRGCFPIQRWDAHGKKWIRCRTCTAPSALASREADYRVAWVYFEHNSRQ
ncbi:MAG: hypothetical protein AW07_03734 [Candidatus Accumulibacter sp. SK-11]|nr:MAG: hypothetical protein AW07_03734 [Candidatus Accumulibacter sp. SK-11]